MGDILFCILSNEGRFTFIVLYSVRIISQINSYLKKQSKEASHKST